MNSINIIGRLTRDPEKFVAASGINIANFTVAVDRKSSEKATDFIDVKAFKQSADYMLSYGAKGRLVAVEGRLQIEEYEVDGKKRRHPVVIANSVALLDKSDKKEGSSSAEDLWDE